jgi:low temperature requirement protein LtrA
MSDSLSSLHEHERTYEQERRGSEVTPFELFFDLVFVFGFIQVTTYLADNLTWTGVLRGIALLATLWWAWICYSWLTNSVPTDEGLRERVVLLCATAAMFVAALAVPNAFGRAGVLFGVAYFVVRALHVGLYAIATESTPGTRDGIFRLGPGLLTASTLLVIAGFLDGALQATFWIAALAIDYGTPAVKGVSGFGVHAEHFVERYRDIVIIALGESILAIGLEVRSDDPSSLAMVAPIALLGIALAATLAWLYFDQVTIAMEQNLARANDTERASMARDTYSYLHLPIVAGIIFVALGLKKTVAEAGTPLDAIPAVALCGGAALYLLGDAACRLRDTGSVGTLRLAVAATVCGLVFFAIQVPAFVTLAVIVLLFAVLTALKTAGLNPQRRVHADRT